MPGPEQKGLLSQADNRTETLELQVCAGPRGPARTLGLDGSGVKKTHVTLYSHETRGAAVWLGDTTNSLLHESDEACTTVFFSFRVGLRPNNVLTIFFP